MRIFSGKFRSSKSVVTARPLLIFTMVAVRRAATVRPPTSPWEPAPPKDMEKIERKERNIPPKADATVLPGARSGDNSGGGS